MNTTLPASLTLLSVMLMPCNLHAATAVPANRVQLLNHGINMPNLLHGDSKFNTFRNEDLSKLRAMGIGHVRIPVEIGYVLPGFVAPSLKKQSSTAKDVDAALSSLDQYVSNFAKSEFSVTLALFMHEQFKKLGPDGSKKVILQALDVLTSRYAGKYNPDQLLFDVSEPQFEPDVWNDFVPVLVAAIRKKAPLHTVIIEPTHYETNYFPQLKALDDKNIIYSMHIYWPSDLTMQGQAGKGITSDEDARFPSTRHTYAKLEAWMHKGIDWAAANQVPLVMEEFGCSSVCDPKSRANWLAAVRQIAEKNNVPWSYWSFAGKIFGLKPSMTGDYDPCLVQAISSRPLATSPVQKMDSSEKPVPKAKEAVAPRQEKAPIEESTKEFANLVLELESSPDGVLRVMTNTNGSFKSLVVKSTVKAVDDSGKQTEEQSLRNEAEPRCKKLLGKWLEENCVFLRAPDRTVTIETKNDQAKDAAGNTVRIRRPQEQKLEVVTIPLWLAAKGLEVASKEFIHEGKEFVLLMYLTPKTLSDKLAIVGERSKAKPETKSLPASKGAANEHSQGGSKKNVSVDGVSVVLMTKEELANFDGKNGAKMYVAVNGLVYDVTGLDAWKTGEYLGGKAGTEISGQIHVKIREAPHNVKVLGERKLVGKLAD
jgi:endoglucanase